MALSIALRDLLSQFNAKSFDGCVSDFHELMYEMDDLGIALHAHVLGLSVINPQIALIAQLIQELAENEVGKQLRQDVVRSCQKHFQSCYSPELRCCVANACFAAELFKQNVLPDRAIMGMAHRFLFGFPKTIPFHPTEKDIAMLSVLLATVGSRIDVAPTDAHVAEIIDRVREIRSEISSHGQYDPSASLLELVCWCRSRRWDEKMALQIVQAVHRCVAERSRLLLANAPPEIPEPSTPPSP